MDVTKLGAGLSLDDALLQGAIQKLDAEEISRRLGGAISPARVVMKLQKLLQTPDWYTEAMQERALLLVLERRVAEMERNKDNESIKLQASIVKDLLAQLNRRKGATDAELSTYNANVGRVIGQVVDHALAYMKGALREEVDSERWDELVTESLAMARHEIEKHQVDS